jgi:hypothetical protein
MSLFDNPLLHIATKVLEGVFSTLTKQVNVVDEMVKAPLKGIVQEVLNGAWTGKGADAFVEKINGEVLGGVETVMQTITDTNTKVHSALDRLKQADAQGAQRVQHLNDQFQAIC